MTDCDDDNDDDDDGGDGDDDFDGDHGVNDDAGGEASADDGDAGGDDDDVHGGDDDDDGDAENIVISMVIQWTNDLFLHNGHALMSIRHSNQFTVVRSAIADFHEPLRNLLSRNCGICVGRN